MSALTVASVSKQFGDFYVPRYEVLVGGVGLAQGVLRDVMQVTYNDSITDIDSFDLTVGNWDPATRDFKYVGAETKDPLGDTVTQRLFNPGAHEFELRLGYGSTLTSMMRGRTTSLEPTFPNAGAPTLTVRVLNVLHRLRRKQYRDQWPNMRISDVAEEIGRRKDAGKKRFPLPIRVSAKARRQEPVQEYIAQDNQYDIDFLLIQAHKIGYDVFIDHEPAGKDAVREVLRFVPSDESQPTVREIAYELKWGVSLIDFAPKLSTAHQAASVEVRSWDRQKNRPIRAKADVRTQKPGINDDLLALLLDAVGLPHREHTLVHEPQHTRAEAQRRAQTVLTDKLKTMVEATGTTVGLPNLRAGQKVHISGLGKRFSGIYFVVKTTHTLGDGGYLTKFTARREKPEPPKAANAGAAA
jgi:phage protein D